MRFVTVKNKSIIVGIIGIIIILLTSLPITVYATAPTVDSAFVSSNQTITLDLSEPVRPSNVAPLGGG